MVTQSASAMIWQLSMSCQVVTTAKEDDLRLFIKMCIDKSVLNSIFLLPLFLTPILAEWNTRDYIRREHSLTKPYQGW